MGHAAGKTVIGLDIEPGYVAAVESRSTGAIKRAAVAPLAAGVVREGEVEDIDVLPGVLRKLFSENKLSRRVRLGVANQRIVMRTLHLPPMKDQKELASAIRFQAQEKIPMPLEQAVLEHHSAGDRRNGRGPADARRRRCGPPRHDRQAAGGGATRRPSPRRDRPVGVRDDPSAAPSRRHRSRAVHQRRRDHEPCGCRRKHVRVHARRGARQVDGGRSRRPSWADARARSRLAPARRPADANRRCRRRSGDRPGGSQRANRLGRTDRRRGPQLTRLLHDAGGGQPGPAYRP